MRNWALTFILALSLVRAFGAPQESSPPAMMPQATPRVTGPEPAASSTVMLTNSMNVLDDQKRLGPNDFVSFRVVEDRDNESQRLRVNDNGQL